MCVFAYAKANKSMNKKRCAARHCCPLEVSLSEFKSCLLAALRSTLPQVWTPKHEEAWTWLWDNVVRSVNQYTVTWQILAAQDAPGAFVSSPPRDRGVYSGLGLPLAFG